MNDFSELEDQLKKLRPAKVSDELFALVEEELVDLSGRRWRTQPTRASGIKLFGPIVFGSTGWRLAAAWPRLQ